MCVLFYVIFVYTIYIHIREMSLNDIKTNLYLSEYIYIIRTSFIDLFSNDTM